MSSPRKRAVVFISGSGSNMMALVAAAKAADYPAEIVGVISDKADAGGLAKAAAEGIATFAFPRNDYASKDAHEAAIFSALDELSPDILCLAGYMRLLTATFIQRYEGRMLNIHPSLLPLHKGLKPQQQALDAGDVESGCTVHWVIPDLDDGPTILQARVPVEPGDDADTLAARILVQEHKAYPQALAMVVRGEARFPG